jgi:sugar O-acyltransferase (sialic acid O-acetyltransferase NeuD family)
MERLLIFPCNGNALEALDCLPEHLECIGFIDDHPDKKGTEVSGIPVLGREALRTFPDARVLAVPGGPSTFRTRDQAIASLDIPDSRYVTVIHPKASVSAGASVGTNTLIMAGAVITSNARIGNHVCILPNSVVHHDSCVGDFTLIGSQVVIAGNTQIGARCYIGSGTTVINGISVADGTLVGMGSNVIRPITEGPVHAGNPAKPLREK